MAETSSLSSPRASLAGLAALAVAAAVLAGCDSSSTEPERTVPFETLAKAALPDDGGPVPIREVVRDAARYEAVWRELWGDREIGRPAVDFDRHMVVAVTHPTEVCLADVAVTRVVRKGFGARIEVGESGPHLCNCIQAEITFHVVRLPRLPGAVDFSTHRIPSRCGQ